MLEVATAAERLHRAVSPIAQRAHGKDFEQLGTVSLVAAQIVDVAKVLRRRLALQALHARLDKLTHGSTP